MQKLSQVTIKAYTAAILANDRIVNAIIVYLAALASFNALPFFPLLLSPFAAILPAYVAYIKKPEYGIIVLAFLNVLTTMYQSTLFGWFYLLLFSIVLFKAWTNWKEIAFVHIIVLMPFAVGPFSLFGGFVYLAFFIGSLHLGSFKAIALSLPSVILVLLLSSLWQIENNAYFPVAYKSLLTNALLERQKPVDLFEFPKAFSKAINNVGDLSVLYELSSVFGIISNNLITIIVDQGGWLQIVYWTLLLYFSAFYTGLYRDKEAELRAATSLFTIPIFYFAFSYLYKLPFKFETIVYSLLSYAVIVYLNKQGYVFSRERIEKRLKDLKPFSAFNVQDLSVEGDIRGFEDVAGYEELKKELIESIKVPLENPKIAYAYGLKPPKGLLLFGPPGTGKTYIMKALAKELNFPFLYVKASQILSPYYGESEKNISAIFELARKKAPVVLFFDEIDAIAKKRTGGSLDDVTPRVLNTLLQELEGTISNKPVIFVAATNVPNAIDPALLRPGRIDKVIYMGVPDIKAREKLFKYHLEKVPHEKINYEKLAKMTERYSPADIANVVQEAKRLAAERAMKTGNIEPVTMEDLEKIIKVTKPSISAALLEEHEQFKLDFERKTSKPKEEKAPELTFNDVADMEDAKRTLKEAIELPIKYAHLVEEFQLKPPRGLLLFGPPGTGKTYIMKAAAGEFKVPIIFLSGAELLKRGYYDAAIVLKEAFDRAKDNAPSIIFIDEIETVAPARGSGNNPLIGQLLQEMDGLKNIKNVIVVGATNLPFALDPALLRPGRFDRIIYVPPPSKEVRKNIFNIHLGKFS